MKIFVVVVFLFVLVWGFVFLFGFFCFLNCLGSGKLKLCVNWSLQVLVGEAEWVPQSKGSALCWETCCQAGAAWTL